jgi:hypothetical protein
MQVPTGIPQPSTDSDTTTCEGLRPAESTNHNTPSRICPVCTGPLVLGRGQHQCVRCRFTLCVGCEDGFGNPSDDY